MARTAASMSTAEMLSDSDLLRYTLPGHFSDDLHGALTLLAADVAVGDHADSACSDAVCEDAVALELLAELTWSVAGLFNVEDDDVGLDGCGIDVDAWQLREALGEEARVFVIACKLSRPFFKRDESGGSEDASLTHAAAQALAIETCFVDICFRAHDHRT